MESRGCIKSHLRDNNTETLLLPVTPAKAERRVRTAKPSTNRAVNASKSCEDDGLEDGDKISACKPRQYQRRKFISLMNHMKDETNALHYTTISENDEEESKSINETLSKKQKRKKHRPKVINESPKKNIDPATPKQKNDKKIITYKRKRRSPKQTTMNSVEEVNVMKKEAKATSRRCLDFDLNDHPTEGCPFRCGSVGEGSLFIELQKLDREMRKKPRTKIKKPRNKAASPCHHMLPARAAAKIDHFPLLYKPDICMLCLVTENTPKPRTKRRTHNKGHMRPDEFDEHQYDLLSWGCRKRMCYMPTKDFVSASQSFMVSAQSAKYVQSSKIRSYERIIHQSIKMAESANCDFDGRILSEGQTTAIVPYEGVGQMTVYERLYESKKAKQRAKVDLCEETMRVWGLLMGKTEDKKSTIDPDRERFWEKERCVFKGRAEAFIARMHLQQGDRRFSQWKGSVVDSIVGAFLTQNVSDHQSSSAFMALAAKFPLRPKGREWECDREEISRPRKQEGYPSEDDIWKNEHIVFHEDSLIFHNHEKIMDRNTKSSGEYIGSSETDNMNTELIYNEKEKKTSQILPRREICEPLDTTATSWSSVIYSFSSRNLCTMFNKQMKPNPTFQDTVNIIEFELIQDFSKFCTLSDEFIQLNGDQTLQKLHDDEGNFVQSSTKLDHHSIGPAPLSERKNSSPNTNSIQKPFPTLQYGKRKEQTDNKKEQIWTGVQEDLHLKNSGEQRSYWTMDCLDYEALRRTNIDEISNTIRERGMNNLLAKRIKDFLNRLVREGGSIDLEWLRDAPPDKSREYLLSIKGLGLKSVECIRLLTLQQPAFPVDTNVGRICVRLGWVPLQPLPESLQLHLLELYPILEQVQKYLWPRLCKLDQQTLYELHYQMITFGKVFCTKNNPNCNDCPMRAECKHFASAFSSERLRLPAPQENSLAQCVGPLLTSNANAIMMIDPIQIPPLEEPQSSQVETTKISYQPIIEIPSSPEAETIDQRERDIEDAFWEGESSETLGLKLSDEEFSWNLQHHKVENIMELQDVDISKALVALKPAMASIPRPKLKNMCRLRTEHQVYELPDSHVLLSEMDPRQPDDPSPYLLALWTPGETTVSHQEPIRSCSSLETCKMCEKMTCLRCNNYREVSAQMVRGTILIPCRTATRGGFPLNGTYFQVNEVFADHKSSLRPIEVPRKLIWSLPRRTVYFGTSIPTIFRDCANSNVVQKWKSPELGQDIHIFMRNRSMNEYTGALMRNAEYPEICKESPTSNANLGGLTGEEIQHCFWRGFVCVRAFDTESRAPRPLTLRLHFPPSMADRRKNKHNTLIAE